MSGCIYVSGGKITEFSKEEKPCEQEYDFTGKYISAGFIDMHTHGGDGHPFVNGTANDVELACNFHLKHGTTSILPTISAAPFTAMRAAVKKVAEAKRSGRVKNNIVGAHLEGPYLSRNQCGAQCPAFISVPLKDEYEQLVRDYGDAIARWTYAPEEDEEGAFCRFLTLHHIVASAGHTDATYADMQTAIGNGCRLVTHLYSCTSMVTRKNGFRSLGVVESTFLRDELYAEIIADGKHLPPDLIRMIVKIKGIDKVALCTDSLAITGTPAKEGVMSGVEYIVEDGVCKLKDRSAFAGSIAAADRLVRTLVKECGFTVPDAVYMLTAVPARILGLQKGIIGAGYDADIVVFDENIAVERVFVGGINFI